MLYFLDPQSFSQFFFRLKFILTWFIFFVFISTSFSQYNATNTILKPVKYTLAEAFQLIRTGNVGTGTPALLQISDAASRKYIDGSHLKELQKKTITFQIQNELSLSGDKNMVSKTGASHLEIPANTTALLVNTDKNTNHCTIRFLAAQDDQLKNEEINSFITAHNKHVQLMEKEAKRNKKSITGVPNVGIENTTAKLPREKVNKGGIAAMPPLCPVIGTMLAGTGKSCEDSLVTISCAGLSGMGSTYGVEIKYSSSSLIDPYSEGTTLATITNAQLTGSGTEAVTAALMTTPGDYFLYAILSPTPADVSCQTYVTTNLSVKSTPNVDDLSDITDCEGVTIPAVTFSGSVPETTFEWQNSNISIGLASSGTGNLPSFTAQNPGDTAITATITVTPVIIQLCPSSDTLYYTGAMQTWQVPAGVTSVTIEAYGASGGDGSSGTITSGIGGRGSKVVGDLAVTGGSTLNVFVGGAGTTTTGGYNGGGTGGNANSGGGGGATDVRYPGTSAADRVIVAAGGGGGGRHGCETSAGKGGDGGNGDENGQDGSDVPTPSGAPTGVAGGGKGGTTAAGGSKGIGCSGFTGQDGTTGSSAGLGGNGGDGQNCCCFSTPSTPGGGGGGGGYHGGGGGGGGSAGTVDCSGNDKGAGGGGAGGTSYIGGVTNGALTKNVQAGDGYVIISYTNVACVSCNGHSKAFTMTIKPAPDTTITTTCSKSGVSLTAPAGDSYSWSNMLGTTESIDVSEVGTYTVTVTSANNCSSTAGITLTQNNLPPTLDDVSDITDCEGVSIPAITFSGSVPGTSFEWHNSNTSIGIAASGTGNLPAFTAQNPGDSTITATITVTPVKITLPTVSDTLFYTGAMQTWQVPAGINSITIEAFGAAGGDGATGVATGGIGGKGSKVVGDLAVTGGSTLNVFVGGAGTTTTGGYNGGGTGGNENSGGGGGATDVRYPGTATADRLIVAAGGGGGGRHGCETSAGKGGDGGNGDENGMDGSDVPTPNGVPTGNAGGGKGGTTLAGGIKGLGCPGFTGQDGTAGTSAGEGGNGGDGQGCCCFSSPSTPGGGGGGGGYNGGGGGGGGSAGTVGCSGNDKGAGGGGAGGTSYTGGVTSGVLTKNVQSGNGYVVFTYANGTGSTCYGPSKTFTVTIKPAPDTTITTSTGDAILTCLTNSVTLTAPTGASYSWSNMLGTTQSISASEEGTYTVSVTSANNCSSTADITLTKNYVPPTAVITNNSGITEVSCLTPTISLTASGGNTYQWSGGQFPNAATNKITSAGTYTVTVTDANGCKGSTSIVITQSPNSGPGEIVIGSLSQPTCTPLVNGKCQLSNLPSGSWTLYQEGPAGITSFTGSGNQYLVENLPEGTYRFQVKDAMGCKSPKTGPFKIIMVKY